MNKRQYFIVGASYGGNESQYERFIKDGIWVLGWHKDDDHMQYEAACKMKPGDFIAIKRRNGRGAKTMTILARGVVKSIITDSQEDGRFICQVHWYDVDVNESVPMHHRGSIATVTGPLFTDDVYETSWLMSVFGL